MKIRDLLRTVKVKEVYGILPNRVKGITADTSRVQTGFAFLAIKGLTTDGHDLVSRAKELGAILIIAEHNVDVALPVIVVENTRSVWGILALASKGNPQHSMKLIGVTGTNGKTTVTTLIHQILTKLGYNAGLMGTISTKIGSESIESKLTTGDPELISETLLKMKQAGCSVAIMEVSSHALDQHRVNGLNYDVAVFTNLTQDHLDYHKTMESYAQAKKKLFDGLKEDAVAIVNTDDVYHQTMIEHCVASVWGFGVSDGSLKIHSANETGSMFELNGTLISTQMSGKFNVYNASSAYLACLVLGCSEKNTAHAISEVSGAEGRLERVNFDAEAPVVFVDYAHTPDALKNVLETLQVVRERGSLIVVFGCGGDRDRSKRPKMGAVSVGLADKVYLTSDNPRSESPEAIITEIASGIDADFISKVTSIVDRKEAIFQAISDANDADVVLIAGKGHETYQEIKGVRYPLDDRLLAAAALDHRRMHLTMQGGA